MMRDSSKSATEDVSFAVIHGLYWLSVNLAERQPVLLAIDDAHSGDEASQRWLAYLAARFEGMDAALVVTLRPGELPSQAGPLLAVRAAADATLRPALLSEQATARIARVALASEVDNELCAGIHRATGGNPFYVLELLRALKRANHPGAGAIQDMFGQRGLDAIGLQLGARLRSLDPHALRFAQAIAVLAEGSQVRHAAAVASMDMAKAMSLATELVRLDVLAEDQPPRFLHPIVRDAVIQTLSSAEHDAIHRTAARVLHAEGSSTERVAAHAMRVRPAGEPWVVERLREGARGALEGGAPAAAAGLLERALAEPPSSEVRVEVLREAARAQLQAGRSIACQLLEEALALAEPRVHAEVACELARTYAALFRWADAVQVLDRTLHSCGGTHRSIEAHLEGQLVAAGLQDARVVPRALQVLKRMSRRRLAADAAAALGVAQGMVAIMTGQSADKAALPLERALAALGTQAEDWDMQAALWWCLLTAERFGTVEDALAPLRERVDRSGSSRGLVAVYSTLGLLKLRLGALPEADAAARVALRVAEEGDFAPGLPFAATVQADIAVASGALDEAEALLDRLPRNGLPAGVGTVLIPAARGRLRLAQGRASEALAEFEACMALWRPDVWGIEMRDAGYLHARSGAAQALLALGNVRRAAELAEAELTDVRRFAGRRALGVALRVAGLARGGEEGLAALEESVAVLAQSPAALERARSLVEWGAALRRAGRRHVARPALSHGLDAAARCGARPLIARAREELRIAGARPRRDWTSGVEALTPSELRIVGLAREGRSNRQIAQELFLSIKTVEGHLARAYGKLEITTRRELDRVLEPKKTRVPTL
jgi:DNA-binding CsgD family transcriptional regulator